MNRYFSLFMISITAILAACSLSAHAAELEAVPSSTEVGQDENISIEFRTTSDSLTESVGQVKYEAPDFDEINSYGRGQSVETHVSVDDNGNQKIVMRRTQSVISVLHPRRLGRLTIRNIHIDVGGKTIRAPDVVIEVQKVGGLAQQGSNNYSSQTQSQSRGGGLHSPRSQHASSFFIRTEPSKLKAYKGEQIILTYALYTRVQIVNLQVERYPNITGFLKEDVDIPLLRGRLDYSPAVVNGYQYRRAVLAQYAIYPVQEGKLPIDTFTGKFSYQTAQKINPDDDDPFGMFNQFFRAMQTSTDVRSSDQVSIEVMPLPAAGQPQNFQGLVGEFDVTAVADKYTVKVGEPINVKVKLEGKGHAGSLERLNVNWPQDFELYEDKSNTQFLRSGQTERLFEYMLIPKVKGKHEIPAIEVAMFNPDTKSYQTRKTQPMTIEVLEGSLGNVYIPKGKPDAPAQAGQDIRYWLDSVSNSDGYVLRSVARGIAMASMVFALMSLWSLAGSGRENTRQTRVKAGQRLRERAKALTNSSQAPAEVFANAEALLSEALGLQYGISTGSLTRSEIRQSLLEKAKLDESTAKRIETLFETCENQRYAPGGGAQPQAQQVAQELVHLLDRIC